MRIHFVTTLVFMLAGTALAQDARVTPLMKKELLACPNCEVSMVTVEYPPGGTSASHRHNGQVFVYVLEGALEMQVAGKPLVTVKAGETFYEAPEDVHAVSRNASKTASAKFVVVLITPKKPAGS